MAGTLVESRRGVNDALDAVVKDEKEEVYTKIGAVVRS